MRSRSAALVCAVQAKCPVKRLVERVALLRAPGLLSSHWAPFRLEPAVCREASVDPKRSCLLHKVPGTPQRSRRLSIIAAVIAGPSNENGWEDHV